MPVASVTLPVPVPVPDHSPTPELVPDAAAPDVMNTLPEFPLAVVPEEKIRLPLAPDAESDDRTITAPEETDPDPLNARMEPPASGN